MEEGKEPLAQVVGTDNSGLAIVYRDGRPTLYYSIHIGWHAASGQKVPFSLILKIELLKSNFLFAPKVRVTLKTGRVLCEIPLGRSKADKQMALDFLRVARGCFRAESNRE